MTRCLARFVVVSISIATLAAGASAQQRPLITEDVDIIKPGVIRIESGFEFLQNQTVSPLRSSRRRYQTR